MTASDAISAPPLTGHASRTGRQQSANGAGPRICLLGGFELAYRGCRSALSPASQRLVAFLALQGAAVRRDLLAGVLWPDASERRAHGCLRSGLVRLGDVAASAVDADAVHLSLAAGASVDLAEGQRIARRLLDPGSTIEPAAAVAALPLLAVELLPGWYEDWALLEAERWRQLRLHALEALAALLVDARRYGEAAEAAAAAVRADPLRETAYGAMIAVHLAEGNQSEALREFERYRRLLHVELGLEPTDHLRRLLPVQPDRCVH